MDLFSLLLPELILVIAALVLFLFGVVKSPAGRRVVPFVALLALAGALAAVAFGPARTAGATADWTGAVSVSAFSTYARVLTLCVGTLFVLLSWPTNDDATGNSALRFGSDAGEFFALILLSLCGIMVVASANDTMLLFMGIELASIPTYILVSTGRPLPAAQEAGVKYFYLGAMTAAVLLFGFAYLYGATGTTSLFDTGRVFAGQLSGLGVESAGAGAATAGDVAGAGRDVRDPRSVLQARRRAAALLRRRRLRRGGHAGHGAAELRAENGRHPGDGQGAVRRRRQQLRAAAGRVEDAFRNRGADDVLRQRAGAAGDEREARDGLQQHLAQRVHAGRARRPGGLRVDARQRLGLDGRGHCGRPGGRGRPVLPGGLRHHERGASSGC